MRFLGVTETCDLASLYLRLAADGHEVRIAVSEPLAEGTLASMIPRVADWQSELDWIRAAGDDGVILFEAVSEGFGTLQDELRRDGLQVIGGSAFGDRLENDRAFAQALLAELGFPSGHVWEFSDVASADAFVASRPGRYVIKASGAGHSSSDTYVGQRADGMDVRAMLRTRQGGTFILQEHIDGIEMGVGAYFDGRRFLAPACLDWEHKRFFPGDLGELTGEMGTVATYDRSRRFFEATLAKIEPHLREGGHVGYVNVNTIVNEDGIWPLEFTSRFGYPGYAILDPLQDIGWGDLFRMMVRGHGTTFRHRPGFSVGVVLTTPPFPYSRHDIDEAVGLPILLDEALSEEDRRHLHFGEVGLRDGQLVTSGLYGWTMVVSGVAATIGAAREAAYRRVRGVSVPNLRYRHDIGERLMLEDFARLEQLGWLSATAPAG